MDVCKVYWILNILQDLKMLREGTTLGTSIEVGATLF